MFLLPIYAESPAEFDTWLNGQVHKYRKDIEEASGHPVSEQMQARLLEKEKERFGAKWKFNRAIGWIHVTRAVGGFTFNVAVASNKKRRQPKKSFNALELQQQPNQGKRISFDSKSSTPEIIERFESIFKEIISSHSTFKGGYVDSTSITDNADFINWKATLETEF